MKFKVGDRVRAVKRCDGRNLIGYEGTVKIVDGDICARLPIGVEFDKCFDSGHDLDGSARNRHGRWCEPESLELIKDETIVIYRKDNEVIALDKRTGKKAVAKCSPDDTFNFDTGVKLAFERLTKNVTFRVLCVKDSTISEKGKVYEFVDGVTTWRNGTHSNKYDDINDFKRKNCISYGEHFIELKDGDDPAKVLKEYDREIRVGDTVKVMNTGLTYTTNKDWFKENNISLEYAVKFAYADDLGYSEGVTSPVSNFKVVALADNKALIENITSFRAKCYLIDVKGLKKC